MRVIGATEWDFQAQMLFWGWAITAPDIPASYRPDSAVLASERSGLDTVALGLWDRDAAWLAVTEFWVDGARQPSPYRWCLAGSPAMWAGAA